MQYGQWIRNEETQKKESETWETETRTRRLETFEFCPENTDGFDSSVSRGCSLIKSSEAK